MTFRLRSAGLLLAVAVLSQPAAAGLFGPSSDILKGDALAAKLKSQPIVLSVGGGALDVRSKSAAVGSFLLGFVVSSALASGGGTGQNVQQMQKNAQASMQISQELHKNLQVAMTRVASDLAEKPKAQIAKEGPVVLVSQQLLASLLQQSELRVALAVPDQPPAATDLQLRISQSEWKLDYSMASSDYTLLYQTEVSLYQKESDTVFFSHTCKGEAPRKLPLEDWQRDDFSEVALAAADIGNRCAQPLIAALGLVPAAPQPATSQVVSETRTAVAASAPAPAAAIAGAPSETVTTTPAQESPKAP